MQLTGLGFQFAVKDQRCPRRGLVSIRVGLHLTLRHKRGATFAHNLTGGALSRPEHAFSNRSHSFERSINHGERDNLFPRFENAGGIGHLWRAKVIVGHLTPQRQVARSPV